MTDPTRTPDAPVVLAARATLTLSVRAVSYVDARCPECARKVAAVPGPCLLDVRAVTSDADRSGRGVVVSCKRCSLLCEIVRRA
jgi:hypothetical protein